MDGIKWWRLLVPMIVKKQRCNLWIFFFFLNDTATPETSTLPLHAPLPIWPRRRGASRGLAQDGPETGLHRGRHTLRDHRCDPARPGAAPACGRDLRCWFAEVAAACWRSEEHTSELQSQSNLVCRLLLEKKK